MSRPYTAFPGLSQRRRARLLVGLTIALLVVSAWPAGTRALWGMRGATAAPPPSNDARAGAVAQLKTERFAGHEVVAGEVIVRFRAAIAAQAAGDVSAAQLSAWREKLAAVEQELDADRDEELGLFGARLIHSRTKDAAALIALLAARPDVEYAEPNYIVRPTAVPNDPQFAQLWALQNTGQSVQGIAGTPGADIRATQAWDVDTNRGSTANVVGIVDTGLDYTHPDLAANVWSAPAQFTVNIRGQSITCAAGTHGFNAITRTCDPADDDVNSHGTHIAGTIGAVGNNNAGIAGVNWNARLMGLKFIGAGGSDIAHAIDAISFAIQVKSAFAATAGANVRVLNNSWGPADNVGQSGFSQELLNTVNAANTNQMLFVASAGNLNSNNDATPYYPASYNSSAANVISVAASDQFDNRAGFSNLGATTVDVAAPGTSILSTFRNGGYGYLSGTSMSAAYTSGAAALVLARCSALDTGLLKSTLLDNADGLTSLNGVTKPKTGQPGTGRRLNVNAAIASCAAAFPPSVTRSLSANADAYVNKVSAATNFGSAAELQVKQTAAGDDTHDRYTYLKFDLASVSGQINQAKLRLFGSLTNASIGSTPINVQQAATTTWDEATITWNNQPGVSSATVLATQTVTGTTAQFYDFDLTAFIQAERAAGRNTISLRLVSTQATGTDDTLYTRFNSKEAATNAPQLVVTTPPACVPAPANLITWYPGDGNTNDIQSGNNGTLMNGATFTLGKVGQAFSFDGVDDYLFVPGSSGLDYQNWQKQTISFWLNWGGPKATTRPGTTNPNRQYIWSNVGSSGDTAYAVVVIDDAGHGAGPGLKAVGARNTGGEVQSVAPLPTIGSWEYYTCIFDKPNGQIIIYKNGTLINQVTWTSSTGVSSGPKALGNIGYSLPSVDYNLKGNLDEFVIKNDAFSATEIQNIYNAAGAGVCKPTYVCTPPPSNMVAWFPGEGNGFDIQSGNVGALVNGATFAPGKVGQAFSFDGVNDYVQIPDAPAFDLINSGAISIWVYLNSVDAATRAVLDKGRSDNNQASYTWEVQGGVGSFRFDLYKGDGSGAYITTEFPASEIVGAWTHLTVTWDAGTLRLYRNGTLYRTANYTFTRQDTSYPVQLGSSTAGVPPISGRLDEVQFYSRTLSASEIQAIYNAGSAGLCRTCAPPAAGLVGWYAGDGNASDLASGNTGTLQGTQGGPVFTTGMVGQAFNLNGINSDDMLIGNPAALRLTKAVTLTSWVNLRSDLLEGQRASIVTKWTQANTNTDASYGFWLFKTGGILKLTGSVKGNVGGGAQGGSLQLNTWYHVAMTYDTATGNILLYVNGEQVGTSPATGPIHDGPLNAYIGREESIQPNFFDGLIDEAQIYNRALTAAEIQAIYNAGSQGNCKVFAPNNDNFADAQLISGVSGGVTGSNVGATKEQKEPFHVGQAGGASVWYKWTAPASGSVQFTTAKSQFSQFPSDFDTLLAVYTGSSVSALTPVAANDDAGSSTLTSSITFNVTQGVTYYIAVDGTNAQVGFVALSWLLNNPTQLAVFDPLANNNIAFAQAISGAAGNVTGTNVSADKQQGEPNHGSPANPGGASVWYRWRAPAAGNVTFSTAGSTFDTLLSAYTLINPNGGVSFSNLATPAVAGNDDNTAGGTLTSSITFNATANTDYYIAVDGAGQGTSTSARTGKIVLTWRSLFQIAGRVSGAGGGLPSVIVRLSGDAAQETRTDGAGYYTFTNLAANGNYTVTPTRPNVTFAPTRIDFCPGGGSCRAFTADVTDANFVSVIQASESVTIAGTVRNMSGVGINDITITVTGSASGSVQTDGLGRYTLPGLPVGGSYTITPTSAAYTFNPSNRALDPSQTQGDLLGVDFTTASQAFTISGQARAADNLTPLAGVNLTLARTGQPNVQTTTGADGFYTLPVAAGASYTVTASKAGVGFTQPTLSFPNVGANQKDANFTASAAGSTLVINTVAPAAGRTAGGQQITLTGTFTNLSSVMIGGVAATINSSSATQVVVTTPAHATGAVQIDLFPTSGASYTKPNAFAYLPTVFTDNTLVAGVTTAKAPHITELRQAVDAMRAVAGLQPAPWTDPVLTPFATSIKAAHITELRIFLEDAASRLGYTVGPSYTDPSLSAGTPIKRVHIEELRQRVRSIAGT